MPLVMYEYIEVNLVGVVLLLTMLFYMGKKQRKGLGGEQKYFIRMLILNALILVADNGIYLLRGHASPGLILLNHGVCIAYFVMHSWFCYNWVRYVLLRLYPRYRPGGTVHVLLLLPTLASTVLAAISPWTGWVYTISGDNVYHRGSFVWISFAASLVYWLVSSALILREWRHPSRSREAGEYGTLFFFPVLLLFGNLLQLRFYGLSIVWVCAAISVLILFIDIQNEQLSRDELTGLFNRRQTNAQLLWEVNHLHAAEDLLLVGMMDVDDFKQINDRYGHLSGDHALSVVAKALREHSRKSDFVSRYGGDEFLLIGHVKTEADAETIFLRMKGALDAESRAEKLPYSLSLSVGYTLSRPGDDVTMDSLLNAADGNMYAAKRDQKDARP